MHSISFGLEPDSLLSLLASQTKGTLFATPVNVLLLRPLEERGRRKRRERERKGEKGAIHVKQKPHFPGVPR